MANRTVPTLRTFIAGEVEVGAYLNANVRDLGNFLLGVPAFRLRQTVAQSIASDTTGHALLFDTEDTDSDTVHSTITATDTVTLTVAGTMMLLGHFQLATAAAAAGRVEGWMTQNGFEVPGSSGGQFDISTAHGWGGLSFGFVSVAVGDTLKLFAQQSSGAAIVTATTGRLAATFSGFWVSR